MNYTENYHLPQWDETDRIMRVDFNEAMERLEEGLSKGDAGTKTGLDRFCRLAYNHYCAVQDMDPAPFQSGIFHKDVTKDPQSVTGSAFWLGAPFATKTDITLTAEMLKNCYQELTPLKLTKGDLSRATPLTGTFCPPASGGVGSYSLLGTYSNNTTDATSTKLELTLTNQETGGIEHQFEINFPISQSSASFGWLCGTQIKFAGGVNYLVTIRPTEDICDLNLSLSIGGRSVVTFPNREAVSASYPLHDTEGGNGGMAVLRCLVSGNGGDLRFAWDGVEREPAMIRPVKFGDRRAAYDYIFVREDTVPKDSTLSLDFTCNTGGNFLFFGWGAMLF